MVTDVFATLSARALRRPSHQTFGGEVVSVRDLRDFLSAEVEKAERVQRSTGWVYYDGVLDGLNRVRERFAIDPECRS